MKLWDEATGQEVIAERTLMANHPLVSRCRVSWY
jgi:hypothetical protein